MLLIRVILVVTVMCAVSVTFILTLFDSLRDANDTKAAAALMTMDSPIWAEVGMTNGNGTSSSISRALEAVATLTKANEDLTSTVNMLEDHVQGLEKQLRSKTNEWKGAIEAAVKDSSSQATATTTSKDDDSLPMCDDLMNQHVMYRDGAFLSRPTTEVIWKTRGDGSQELTYPHMCRLKRYTATEARQCLAGHHIAVIGDSLSRYQYLGLVHLIENGEHPKRFGRRDDTGKCQHVNEKGEPQCTLHGEKNVCFEGTYRDWQAMYMDVGGGEDGGVFNGRMQCSCAQLDKKNTTEESYTQSFHYVSDIVDNMIIGENSAAAAATVDEKNGNQRIKMTMFNEVGWYDDPAPLNLFSFNNCSYDGSCRHSKEYNDELIARAYNKGWDWSAPLKKALNSTLRRDFGDVDITIYNRGLWNQIKGPTLAELMPLFYDWTGGTEGRCFYRSTTGSTRTRQKGHMIADRERDRLFDETIKAGCGYWDVAHVTREFIEYIADHPAQKKTNGGKKRLGNWDGYNNLYWDAVHFSPWVYEELNNLFLNILCNVKE